jgi:hypothetical protein
LTSISSKDPPKRKLSKPKKLVVNITKEIRAPIDFAYAWCTDFRADDPKINGSSSERIILEKRSDKAVFCAVMKDEKGNTKGRAYIVRLRPPNTWSVKAYGNGFDTTGQYKLTKITEGSTKLSITFEHSYYDFEAVPTEREKKLDSEKSWEKYVSALESDFNFSTK